MATETEIRAQERANARARASATQSTGAKDRARGSEVVSRPRSDPSPRQRKAQAARRQRNATQPKRSQDAESVDEALEIERDTGRREGARGAAKRPITRYGPKGKPDADAAPGERQGFSPSDIPAGTLPSITAPFLFETALIAVDEFTNQKRFPIPSRLLVAWGFFGLLGLARGPASRTATVFAWGLVVATFYATVPGQNKPAGLNTVNTVGDFIGGKYATPGSLTAGPATGATPPTEAGSGGAGSTYQQAGGLTVGNAQ